MFKNRIMLLFIIFFISIDVYSNNDTNNFIELCNNNILSKINGTVKKISKNGDGLSNIEIKKK